MYDSSMAKKDKLMELKRLMYELMADEGEDATMDMSDVKDAMAMADEAVEPDMEMAEGEEMEEGEDEEMDPIKSDFMSSRKGPEKRPGTAIMIAKTAVEKGPMAKLSDDMDSELPMKFKKKKKQWA